MSTATSCPLYSPRIQSWHSSCARNSSTSPKQKLAMATAQASSSSPSTDVAPSQEAPSASKASLAFILAEDSEYDEGDDSDERLEDSDMDDGQDAHHYDPNHARQQQQVCEDDAFDGHAYSEYNKFTSTSRDQLERQRAFVAPTTMHRVTCPSFPFEAPPTHAFRQPTGVENWKSTDPQPRKVSAG